MEPSTAHEPCVGRSLRYPAALAAGAAGLIVVFSPIVVMFLGVFVLVGVTLHVFMPSMRRYLDIPLRIPVGHPKVRRRRLAMTAGAGLLLFSVGAASAAFFGKLRSEMKMQDNQRTFVQDQLDGLMTKADHLLASGDVVGAELVLMEADTIVGVDDDLQREVDELLARVRRSGDADAILAVLIQLPHEEFESFETGASVPRALQYDERALTLRAMEIAGSRLEEARRARR